MSLTFTTARPRFEESPEDYRVVLDSSSNATGMAAFQCEVYAVPPATITWEYFPENSEGSVADQRITVDTSVNGGVTSSELTFTDIQFEDRGEVTCNVQNMHGMLMDSASLNVFGK